MPVWLVSLIISTALTVAASIITPKPKAPKPAAVQDAQYPTAEKGKPVPKIWGTVWLTAPNILHYGDRSKNTYMIKV